MTSTARELFGAFEELQSDIFAKYKGEEMTSELLGRVQHEFWEAINLWRYRPSLINRTKGLVLSVTVTADGNNLSVTPSDDLKTLLEDLIREAIRENPPYHPTGTKMLEPDHFPSQLNLFVKLHTRLAMPFLSVIERPGTGNQFAEHLFVGLRKSFCRLFDADVFKDEFDDLVRLASEKGKAAITKAHVELIVIKSSVGVDPQVLVKEHNLGEYKVAELVLSGGAIDVLHKLFWFGPQNIGDLPSKAGESELIELGFCQRIDVQNAPKGIESRVTMLTTQGLLYAIREYEATKNVAPSESHNL